MERRGRRLDSGVLNYRTGGVRCRLPRIGGVLVELPLGWEYDKSDVRVAEDRDLVCLLQQPRPPLREGHLSVDLILDPLQLHPPSPHLSNHNRSWSIASSATKIHQKKTAKTTARISPTSSVSSSPSSSSGGGEEAWMRGEDRRWRQQSQRWLTLTGRKSRRRSTTVRSPNIYIPPRRHRAGLTSRREERFPETSGFLLLVVELPLASLHAHDPETSQRPYSPRPQLGISLTALFVRNCPPAPILLWIYQLPLVPTCDGPSFMESLGRICTADLAARQPSLRCSPSGAPLHHGRNPLCPRRRGSPSRCFPGWRHNDDAISMTTSRLAPAEREWACRTGLPTWTSHLAKRIPCWLEITAHVEGCRGESWPIIYPSHKSSRWDVGSGLGAAMK